MTHCEACYDLGAECECDRHSKTPSTTSKPVEALRSQVHLKMLEKSESAEDLGELTVVPLGFAVDVAMELIDKQVLEGQIELLLRVKSELPDDDTNCMADHMDGDGCEPKDHWRRDGRFFMSMETNEYISDLIEELKEVRNSSAKNQPNRGRWESK